MPKDITGLLRRSKIEISRGISSAGDIAERLKALFRAFGEDGIVSVEPGDFIGLDNEGINLSLSAPIAYDVWYLFVLDDIMPEGTDDSEEWVTDGRLKDFFDKLSGIKPLRSVRSYKDLVGHFCISHLRNYFENAAPYTIKGMRYETLLIGQEFQYQSLGGTNDLPAYLAFPVGQLGVMEVLSVVSETMSLDNITFETSGYINNMMPPVPTESNKCVGEHLVESGYLLQENVEYPAEEFQGLDSAKPHFWLRRWIQKDETWPMPGEFIALLCRPVPFHVWWWQETSPFVYSGNWFETEHYTSGTVLEVIEPEGSEIGKTYKVRIKGVDVYIKSTDFYEYSVGERVAVLKGYGVAGKSFDWGRLEDREGNAGTSSNPITDWVIVPISFYGGCGNANGF